MILSFKEKTYYIPKNWDEVKVKHYKDILAINLDLVGNDNRLYDLAVLSIFTGLPIEDLKEIPSDVMNEIKDTISFLYISSPSTESKFVFNVNGQTWGLEADLTKLQYGQFIDLENMIEKNRGESEKEIEQWKGIEHWKYIGEMLAIVLRPAIERKKRYSVLNRMLDKNKRGVYVYTLEPYDSKKRKDHANILEESFSVNDLNGIALFFYRFAETSMNVITDYSVEQLEAMQTKKPESFLKRGTGTERFTRWQKETLEVMKK